MVFSGPRFVSSSAGRNRGILLDTDEPKPKTPEDTVVTVTAANITDNEYHKLADDYLQAVLTKFEELQDSREDVDVEYAVREPPHFRVTGRIAYPSSLLSHPSSSWDIY
jgi:frataxin